MSMNGDRAAPTFSIVVPAYQAEATLAETLEAVIAQTHQDWECIVVDDGSRDETLAIARGFATRDGRFRVIHQENGGTAAAYNTGVAAALGTHVVICSADDILLPEHLATFFVRIQAEPDYDIYSSNGFLWTPLANRTLAYRRGDNEPGRSLRFEDVILGCFYSVGAVYRRTWFDRIGGYRVGVYGEDYDFWLRAMAVGARHRYLAEPLSLHRLSMTQKGADLGRVHRSDIELIQHLQASAKLTLEAQVACEDGIRFRHAQLDRIQRPRSPTVVARRVVKSSLHRVLGARRARALASIVKHARIRRELVKRTGRS